MLDENLPTFIFRPMPDHPSSAVVYYTRSGSDPAPEYVFRLADPVSKPACRGVYAAALADPFHSDDVVYGEVAVEPEWQQPTLSAAELREQRDSGGGTGTGAAPLAKTPESFVIQLYNPDQAVTVRWNAKTWNKAESWDFEVPIETFRMPSASRLDRETPDSGGPGNETGPGGGLTRTLSDALAPKNSFRWKRDGRLGNKDMTCYLLGRSVDYFASPIDKQSSSSSRRKEPDITIALVKHARDPAVTIYEPNMQRVDVQDRKGLELVLLLGAQVIRDLYVVPRPDAFNMEGAAAAAAAAAGAAGRRKNSRPVAAATSPTSAAHKTLPSRTGTSGTPGASGAPGSVPSAAAIEAETQRLQALLANEERERLRREQEEERRIKKMLEAEEKEQRRRRDAAIAAETERLRQLYGTDGQDLPSAVPPPPGPPPAAASSSSAASSSAAYNRPVPPPPPPQTTHNTHTNHPHAHLPPRPGSTGPSLWHGSNNNSGNNGSSSTFASGRAARAARASAFLSNPAASVSGFFSAASSNHRNRAASGGSALGTDGPTSRIRKKRSI